mgnify:CR=1 FL=1
MAKAQGYVAVDLGAGSGRVELLTFDGSRLGLEEVHRFPNGPVRVHNTLYWDALRLWTEIRQGLARASDVGAAEVVSVGVDTWGVDFALLDAHGDLLANPVCYRDRRTEGMLEAAIERVGRTAIFEATGVQFLSLNTLYQLLALVQRRSPLLEVAETLVMMPDLVNYWLSGAKVCEFTNATTTQFYNPRSQEWAWSLLRQLGLPTRLLPEVVRPGTPLGGLRPDVAEETGLAGVTVVAPATHDTASAVAAVPARSARYAYVSSGTWSLIGAELAEPRIDAATLRANFTNEGGVDGTIRYLKNAAGFWLVDECRREWARQGRHFTHQDLVELAESATPLLSFVDVDHPAFLLPSDMPAAIRAECARTGQPVPTDEGALVRCILESLALKYHSVLGTLQALLGSQLEAIHVVGGGARNSLLCQMTADVTGLPVMAGPVEATAIGNAIVQMLALGAIGSLREGRELVRRSFEIATYRPRPSVAWVEAVARFARLYPASLQTV